MLYNLRREMRYEGITYKDLAKMLNLSPKTVGQKINQITDFTRGEIFQIKQLFPEKTYEYLFADMQSGQVQAG